MKIAPLAIAATLAAAVGCALPALAQSQDQTGAAPNRERSGMHDQMMNGTDQNESATTGANPGDRSANEQDDDDDNAGGGNWNWHHRYRWSENGPMRGRMGPMQRQRMMMRALGGARFHFRRGNARIDVRCSVQEDMQACVRAAGELIDKIGELDAARRGNTTGSAAGENDDATNGAAPSAPGHRVPASPGERM